jgi:hypothetical protein
VNPGAFIPLALKTISEQDPSSAPYVVDWLFFTLVALSLAVALLVLLVAGEWTKRRHAPYGRSCHHGLLAAALLRNGLSGMTS